MATAESTALLEGAPGIMRQRQVYTLPHPDAASAGWVNDVRLGIISQGVVGLLAVLGASVWLVSHCASRMSKYHLPSHRVRSVIMSMLVLILIVVQTYWLARAALHIPAGPTRAEHFKRFRRIDCFESTKGGKKKDTHRDCHWGQGARCTKEQPCTPCNLERDFDIEVQTRINETEACAPCPTQSVNSTVRADNCPKFDFDTGPWCYYQGVTKIRSVAPCRYCCLLPVDT